MANHARLDFNRLDPGRVTILVNDAANAQPYANHFADQGFHVEITLDPSKLYNALCEGDAPGMVLISDQIMTPMAKMMPDFIVKRFKVPVILFRENPAQPAPDLSQRTFPPEVLPIGSVKPPELVDTVKNFAEAYEERCQKEENGERERRVEVSPIIAPDQVSAVPMPTSEEILTHMRGLCQGGDISVGHSDIIVLHACRIADPSGKGYFVFGFPVRENGLDSEASMKLIEDKLRGIGLGNAAVERLEQSVQGSFFGDLRSHSDEVISGLVENQEMVMLFFRNRAEIEEPEMRISGENFLVPMEEWWTRLPLPCHAYVWLELNKRRVLYVRPGACLRVEAFDRLNRHGVKHLALDPSDFGEYRKIREIIRVAYAPAGATAAA